MASHSKQPHYLQPWHFDCRLSKELPDNNPVRGRFLANLLAGTFATIALFVAGMTLFYYTEKKAELAYWDEQEQLNRATMVELQKFISTINAGGKKLDEIHKLTQTALPVSEFIQEIGRSRPANVRIDMIEYHDGSVFIRGGLRETSQRTTAVLSQYVAELRANPRLRPLFSHIVQTSMERNAQASSHSFEINLKVKAATP
jgi:Tfp pilus assembly protein PilN